MQNHHRPISIPRTRDELFESLSIPTFPRIGTQCERLHHHPDNIWTVKESKRPWRVQTADVVLTCRSFWPEDNMAFTQNFYGDGAVPELMHKSFTNEIRRGITRNPEVVVPGLTKSDLARLQTPTVSSKAKEHLPLISKKKADEEDDDFTARRNRSKSVFVARKSVAYDIAKEIQAVMSKATDTSKESRRKKKGGKDRAKLQSVFQKDIHNRSKEDIKLLFAVMRPLKAFQKLADFLLYELCSVVYLNEYPAERIIFRQGDSGTSWFVILQGQVDIMVHNKIAIAHQEGDLELLPGEDLATLEARKLKKESHFLVRLGNVYMRLEKGAGFGELALVNDAKRAASVLTHEPTKLLRIEKRDYNRILRFVHDKEQKEKVLLMKSIPVLHLMDDIDLMGLSDGFVIKNVPAGTYLIKEGQNVTDIGFIGKGKLVVTKEYVYTDPKTLKQAHSRVVLGSLTVGEYYGELYVRKEQSALVQKSILSVKAVEDSIVATIALNNANRLANVLKHLEPSKAAYTPTLLYEKFKENQSERIWANLRTSFVNGLVRERFKDPNLSHALFQKQMSNHVKPFRF